MPKSRKRCTTTRSSRRRARYSDAELMRSVPLLQAIDEAERRGDAEQALQLMLTHPEGLSFWRPRRYTGLMQMSALAGIAPGWATSRWILSQAHQRLGERHDPVARQRFRRALQVAVQLRGGVGALPGRDLTDQQCRVVDHDWVYRELFLYDLGALRHFLQRVVTPDLLAGADRVAAWAASPMGGYRFVGGDATKVSWEDLADGEALRTANIGSAVSPQPGDRALGRIVPIEGGVMSEMPPLPVPEPAALRVSHHPQGWIEALRAEPPGLSVAGAGPCSGLLSDVPDDLVRQTLSWGTGGVAADLPGRGDVRPPRRGARPTTAGRWRRPAPAGSRPVAPRGGGAGGPDGVAVPQLSAARARRRRS